MALYCSVVSCGMGGLPRSASGNIEVIGSLFEDLVIASGDLPVIQAFSLPPRNAFVVAFDHSNPFGDIGRDFVAPKMSRALGEDITLLRLDAYTIPRH